MTAMTQSRGAPARSRAPDTWQKLGPGYLAKAGFLTHGKKEVEVSASPESLNLSLLNDAPLRVAGLAFSVEVVARTGSTNTDLLARAEAGAAEGLVLVAEEQTAGRGRLGRPWVTPPGTALAFSVLLRPAAIPVARRGWLPLIAGVCAAVAVRALSGLQAQLKWPNDVLVEDGKLAGILAEAAGDAVVVGFGLNVTTSPADLPSGAGGLRPTSLLAAGAPLAREALLAEILRALGQRYERFRADPDPERSGLLAEYRELSTTIGKDVRVELPGAATLAGQAVGIDADGRLLVSAAGQEHAIAAGDVIHVR
jgi:BirA family biotin operon repressor/biotin-[acetyl-CoA-carboxylase] ligase